MRLAMHPRTKNAPVTEETRQYLEKKLSRLSKHFRGEPEAQCVQGFERGQHIVELTLSGDNILLRSQERNSDLRAAIDSVVDKLETQIKRFKGKRVDSHRHHSPIKDEAAAASDDLDGFQPFIARRKTFSMQPLPPEEAARQMELLAHTFFVFINEETGRFSVLYRRENGDYGLIEPES